MNKSNLFRNAVKNPVSTVCVLLLAVVMGYTIVGDIQSMRNAETGYDYCLYLSYLFENIGITYFMTMFFIMMYLTYINKQYSKWSIWLFYVLGVSILVYFFFAGLAFNYIVKNVGQENMNHLASLARHVFTGSGYWMVISLFFVPKSIKDTIKLKEEQDLTI